MNESCLFLCEDKVLQNPITDYIEIRNSRVFVINYSKKTISGELMGWKIIKDSVYQLICEYRLPISFH